MINKTTLQSVSESIPIADHYISARGEHTEVSPGVIESLLAALGYDTSSDDALLASVAKRQTTDVVPSVRVYRQGEPIIFPVNLPNDSAVDDWSWQLTTEQGEQHQGALSELISLEEPASELINVTVPVEVELGYHELTLTHLDASASYAMRVINAPSQCYKQPELTQGKKLWGPSVQLYTLKSAHNWGMGDFGDLQHLIRDIAKRGGDFVGLNPIHALFPANPEAASPYSPSSRRWLNIFYIDVEAVPEFSASHALQQLVNGAEFQQQKQQARDTDWVDYSQVAALKRQAFALLYQQFQLQHLAYNSDRAQQFYQFIEEGGASLRQQAVFDALHAALACEHDHIWGWPAFPDEFRRYDNAAVAEYTAQHPDDVEMYMYLQWIADEQMNIAQQLALELGMPMGIYRDLAVGVADSGSETWADNGNVVLQASVGAPPDVLGPLGQNWGLPPINPEQLQATGYELFIQLLRRNMQHCGALRIDHVMGLLRLWWIPRGESAINGAYMHYPVKDMLAILALESHRQQCSVIGEDLGTVPDEMAELLRDAGVHSYKVFFFETSKTDGGYISPADYPFQSMATLCTHDMPTLRGFWHCEDLKMGAEIGLYPDEQVLQRLFDERLSDKQGILDSVAGHHRLPQDVGLDALSVPMSTQLSDALQLHVATGQSALLSVQLEDWLAMDKPVNVPGTVDEYPNWRRKLSVELEKMFAREDVNHIAEQLTEHRRQASQPND
ncbi:4-alpha-glucanotransferase [Vibrio palustris]|uniref:4-alpha-glucanotransferase n=1 Tax=Vibrio palustris TaxID=1918946 RepID=A0A1R4B624_9VIBR|nr:4-alpha-glucanotransferase [Vibrio palustris]SJL84372.1 4-alpha-glucanotransferase [Vibrio palustris]